MPIDRYIQGIKYAATIFQEFADRTGALGRPSTPLD
jgi:hypothetical protein